MNCTKAIIAVAGFGTRWLPLTKAIEKCMLPVGNRPVIDYLVDDCIKAGITDIYFVVSEQSDQLRRYYGENKALYKHLESKDKFDELAKLKTISSKARFHFIIQDGTLPYGTAVPVMLCQRYIDPSEKVIVLMGDQFVYNKDGASEVANLISTVKASDAAVGLAAVHVPRQEVSKYGILETFQHDHGQFLKRIIEHPKISEAPSTLNNLSMYLFDAELFSCLQHIKPTKGEYYIIDALNIYVHQLNKPIAVAIAKGKYLDCGTVEGWQHANRQMSEE